MYNLSIHITFRLIKSTKFKVFRRNFRTKIIEKPRSCAVCRLLSYYNTIINTSYNSGCFHIYNSFIYYYSGLILLFVISSLLFKSCKIYVWIIVAQIYNFEHLNKPYKSADFYKKRLSQAKNACGNLRNILK